MSANNYLQPVPFNSTTDLIPAVLQTCNNSHKSSIDRKRKTLILQCKQ